MIKKTTSKDQQYKDFVILAVLWYYKEFCQYPLLEKKIKYKNKNFSLKLNVAEFPQNSW